VGVAVVGVVPTALRRPVAGRGSLGGPQQQEGGRDDGGGGHERDDEPATTADALPEDEHAPEHRRQRVHQREPGLRGDQPPGLQRALQQEERRRTDHDRRVGLPAGEQQGEPAVAVDRAGTGDQRRHQPEGQPGGDPEQRGARAAPAPPQHHARPRDPEVDRPRDQPGAQRDRVGVAALGAQREQEDGQARGQRDDRDPHAPRVAPVQEEHRADQGQRELGDHQRLDQRDAAQRQGCRLEGEPADHRRDPAEPDGPADQREDQAQHRALLLGLLLVGATLQHRRQGVHGRGQRRQQDRDHRGASSSWSVAAMAADTSAG
jgi:hypothetical protein